MERRSSSEIGSTAILVALSIASSAMLVASPLFAAGASQLVFGATDATAARMVGLRSPSAPMRVAARALAAACWGGAISALATAKGSSAPRLLFLATALLIGLVVGAYGAAGGRTNREPRGPVVEGPLVGACDAATAAWIFALSIAGHDRPASTRATLAVGIALAIVLRALVVARVVAAAAEDRGTAHIAAIGFIAWLAAGSIACTFAGSATTWSGLGAAVVLTAAAVLAELRRRRAFVVFLRGSLAFAVAAMLGIATFLSG